MKLGGVEFESVLLVCEGVKIGGVTLSSDDSPYCCEFIHPPMC